MRNPFRILDSKLKIALILIFTIIVIGVTGYLSIEKYSFIDALFMTIITVTTVGFREVRELSTEGKIFTIFLIVSSISVFAYAISVLSTHFFEERLSFFLKGYNKKSGIKKMKNHVIVCGFGRNGKQAVSELLAYKIPFVVVDSKHDSILSTDEISFPFIEGDATEDEVLLKAGVKNARALISSLPIDADNLFVALTAKSLNQNINIISRATNDSSEKKLKVAGVSNVVMPEKVGGAHMASLVIMPDLVEFINYISIHGKDSNSLVEIICNNINQRHKNHTLRDLEVRFKTGANIVGYKTQDGEYIINPTPDTVVIEGTKLFVLGTPEQIIKMKEYLMS
jgi:voltage-gated potassium channel